MAEGAGPVDFAVRQDLVSPSGLVTDPKVVATKRREILDGGGTAIHPLDSVVEIALGGRDPTAREHTGGAGHLDETPLLCRGPSPRDAGDDRPSRSGIDHGAAPIGIGLTIGNITGNLANDRTVSGEVAGVVVELRERLEIDADIGGRALPTGSFPTQAVDVHVCPQLLHRPVLAVGTRARRNLVDAPLGCHDAVRIEIEAEQVRRAVGQGFVDQSTLIVSAKKSVSDLIRIDLDAELTDSGSKIARCQAVGVVDDPVHKMAGVGPVEVDRFADQDRRSATIDAATQQGIPHPTEALSHAACEPQLALGGAARETQGRTDLGGGLVAGRLGLVGHPSDDVLGDGIHGVIDLRVVVGRLR